MNCMSDAHIISATPYGGRNHTVYHTCISGTRKHKPGSRIVFLPSHPAIRPCAIRDTHPLNGFSDAVVHVNKAVLQATSYFLLKYHRCSKGMAAIIAGERVGVKEIGITVSIADDPRAKLMYYLSCVFTVIGRDGLPDELLRLSRYQNYRSLAQQDSIKLLVLAKELSPDMLLDKVFFANSALCGNSSNEFFEVSVVSTTMVVASSIMVGGRQCRVRKIMAFKDTWLVKNYINPILQLIAQVQHSQHRALPSTRAALAPARHNNECCIIL